MPQADIPLNEEARLSALRRLGVLDTPAEKGFDAIVEVASLLCGVPISLISLVDEHRQWFKANHGLEEVSETPRDYAFCAHTILSDGILEVEDATLDVRFCDNPIVLGHPHIRFYAGVPLKLSTGENIGTLCIIDAKPHQLTAEQRHLLTCLATAASDLIESHQLKQQFAASESKYRTLSETLPIGVYATDENGAITYTNSRLQEIFGQTAAGDLHPSWASIIHPEDRDRVYEEWCVVWGRRIELDIEFRVRRHDGIERHIHVRSRPVLNAQGEISGSIGSVEDITEQKRNLERLAHSEERLRKLYQSTPAILQTIDAQGCILSVSDDWLQHFGYTLEEVIGRHKTEFMVAESAHQAKFKSMPELMHTGRLDKVAYQMLKKDGGKFDALVSSYLERDKAGKPLRAMEILIDVTSENHAKRENQALLSRVLAQKNQTQQVLDNQSVATYMIDAKHRVTHWNKACEQLTGIQAAEMIGQAAWHGFYDHARPCLADMVLDHQEHLAEDYYAANRRSTLLKAGWHGEVWFENLGGKKRYLIFDAAPILDVHGEMVAVIETLQDVSEAKQAEMALQEERQSLSSVIEGTQVGTWQWNVATGYMLFNDYWTEMLGYKREALENDVSTWKRLTHPDDVELCEAHLQAHFSRQTDAYETEFRMRHKSGHWVWILARGRVLSWRNTVEPEWMYGTHTDITQRKSNEMAILEEKHRVNIATTAGKIGIWGYHIPKGVFECDATINQLYGLNADETLTISKWRGLIHPDDRKAILLAFNEAVQDIAPYDTEFRIVWQDGSIHFIQAKATLIHDEHGKPLRMIGTNMDVTPLRELTMQLANEHETLRVTLNSIGDAVITTDIHARVTWLNPVAESITGWLLSEAKGRRLEQIFHIVDADTRKKAPNPVQECIRTGNVAGLARNTMLISKDELEYGIEDSASPIRLENGRTIGYVLVFHDVTEQRRLSNEMTYRARHDTLTGLVNRTEFETRLSKLLAETQTDDSQHALMYIDLDQFKLVNDACGHTAGDMLLKQVCKILSEVVRSRDTLARLGGDEFAVILERCSVEQAQRVAQTICDRMNTYRFVHDGKRFRVGTSIGMVSIDASWSKISSLIQAADAACYTAKEAGRNRVHVWIETDQFMKMHQGKMNLATRLETALDENQFELFAQRISPVNANHALEISDKLYAEVLLRLKTQEGEYISPAVFIPAAERFYLATRIDRWVLEAVLAWFKSLADIHRVHMINVNLSGQSVGDRSFHAYLIETLRMAGSMVCQRLCLEITETATITNIADATLFIDQVRGLGVKVALDDFGSGASSFGYLKTLKVDILKIDGQFIQAMTHNPLDDSAVRCFVDVARIAGLETIAEYVETEDSMQHVQKLGIHYAQGYLLHHPMPLAGLIENLPDMVMAVSV